MIKVSISVQKLKKDLNQVSNKEISRAWKGYGSALFLELGNLHEELAWKKDGKLITAQKGEWTISSDGAWRIIRNDQIILDAETAKDIELEKAIKSFEGLTLKSILVNEKLTLLLSTNDKLEFNKADYGFFNLISNEKLHIGYENNAPFIQNITT